MSDRAKAAADRIRETASILDVLAHYGYHVRDDGGHREQQFPCDLHGTGRDNKPSARVYPESNSWYCFACDKTRDAIETVRAKEGLDFWGAVRLLEDRYGLEPLPIDYNETHRTGAVEALGLVLDTGRTFEQDRERMQAFLDARTRDRDLPLEQLLAFWEVFDRVTHMVMLPAGSGEAWAPERGRRMFLELEARINQACKDL